MAAASSDAASAVSRERCAERTSVASRRQMSKRSSTHSISARCSGGQSRHASESSTSASTAAAEKWHGAAARSKWPRRSMPSERSISDWLRVCSRSAEASSCTTQGSSSAPRGWLRRRSGSSGRNSGSMPPSESRAESVSTQEMCSERGRASHVPSAVTATHAPPPSVSLGCHAAAICGSSKKARPAAAASNVGAISAPPSAAPRKANGPSKPRKPPPLRPPPAAAPTAAVAPSVLAVGVKFGYRNAAAAAAGC
mmetsp:Transcript_14697/g.47560  ORF Transcript_14697/g.47560 Transcript_14697/m.47560 type:complete len:254 (+) Transcript_14697:72-833(+)